MKNKTSLQSGLWVMLLFMLMACTAQESKTSPYPVVDANFIASTRHGDKIYWLDDYRVIFRGHEGGKPATDEEQKRVKWKWYQWDTIKNRVTLFREDAYGLCLNNGYIFYGSRNHIKEPTKKRKTPGEEQEVKAYWVEGLIGQEKEYSSVFENKEAYRSWRKNNKRNPLDCKLVKRPPTMQGRWWVPLLAGQGYLDKGTNKGKERHLQPITLYKANNDKAIKLPLVAQDANHLQYYPFKGAYFMWRSFGLNREQWDETGCEQGVWLYPSEMKVEKLCIPSGVWNRTSSVLQSKKGLVISPSQAIGDHKIGISGIYLVNKQKYERIINGLIYNPVTSPDGCKVAFAYAKNLGATRIGSPGQRELKMIDLCSQ